MLRFQLFLARTLSMTDEELCNRMSIAELRLWLAEYNREPWGEARGDWQAGQVAATIANTSSDKRSFKPSDFMPEFERDAVESSSEDHARIAQLWTAVLSKGAGRGK